MWHCQRIGIRMALKPAFFTAVIDANIFDADPLCGKDRGENGDGSRLIENIHTEGVIPLDWSLSTVGKG